MVLKNRAKQFCITCSRSKHVRFASAAIAVLFLIIVVAQTLFLGVGSGLSTITAVTHTSQAEFEAGTVDSSLDTSTTTGDVVLVKQTREETTEAQFANGLMFDPFN